MKYTKLSDWIQLDKPNLNKASPKLNKATELGLSLEQLGESLNDVKPEEPHTDIVGSEPTNDSHSTLLHEDQSHPISPRDSAKADFLVSIKIEEGQGSPMCCRSSNNDESHSYYQQECEDQVIGKPSNLKRMKLSAISSLEASEHGLYL